MKPSRLTRLQCDIYLLACEFYSLGAKAMDHTAHAGVQGSFSTRDAPAPLIWAIDYISQIPPAGFALVDMAHRDASMTLSQSRRCGYYLKLFYRRIETKGLDEQGERWLCRVGT